jgi:hypothetical protein
LHVSRQWPWRTLPYLHVDLVDFAAAAYRPPVGV